VRIARWRPFGLMQLITTPVLIVTGAEDRMAPSEDQRALFAMLELGSADKELRVVPNRGHFDILVGSGFKDIMAGQCDFIRRCGRSRSGASRL
jgi:pimeloyl-ACP methyl ester carboxylesterase